MMNQENYRDYIKAAYERVMSGILSDGELCEEAILLYKGASRINKEPGYMFLWGDMIHEWQSMPYDCFCELIGTPTHMVASILIYVWQHSERARAFAPLREAMEFGLLGASSIGFRGHGYEAEKVFLENMRLYETAGALQFVEDYPYISPIFTEEYVKRINALKEIVDYEVWKKQS